MADTQTPETATPETPANATTAPASLPPLPAEYEMPDDYATDWLDKTRRWVEDNPVLAVAAAAGAGLLVGRLLMALVPDPTPTFAERVEKRARQLQKNAASYADDAGDVLAVRLKKASEALSDAADVVTDKAGAGYEKSKDLAEVVADAAKAAVAGVVAQKADTFLSRIRK